MSGTTTRDRILDEAERLFAANGFAGTSLRSVTAAAGVNLAAVSYHFGSKEGLLHAVLHRRIDPVNRERLRRLEEAAAGAADGVPSVEEIVEAFVGPTVEAFTGPQRRHVLGLLRMVHVEEAVDHDFLQEVFGPVLERFGVIERALPHLHPEEVAWRFRFMLGALMHCVADQRRLPGDLLPVEKDPGQLTRRLTTFLVAGFRAPALRVEGSAPRRPSTPRPQESRS